MWSTVSTKTLATFSKRSRCSIYFRSWWCNLPTLNIWYMQWTCTIKWERIWCILSI